MGRHGYGAWEKIRDDPDLGLQDKFFLEEHRVDKKAERERLDDRNAKSPGAVHLVRRADYLISVLKSKYVDDPVAKRAVENHHRNNKKQQAEKAGNVGSPAPGPGSHRKAHRDSEKPRHRPSQGHRDSSERFGTPRADSRHGHNRHDSERRHRDEHGHSSLHNRHGSEHRRNENPAGAS